MRIVCISEYSCFPVAEQCLASMHTSAMVRAFVSLGHEVHVLESRSVSMARATRKAEHVSSGCFSSTSAFLIESSKVDQLTSIPSTQAIDTQLVQLFEVWEFDLIYGQRARCSKSGRQLARALGVPMILETLDLSVRNRILHCAAEGIVNPAVTEQNLLSAAIEITAMSKRSGHALD